MDSDHEEGNASRQRSRGTRSDRSQAASGSSLYDDAHAVMAELEAQHQQQQQQQQVSPQKTVSRNPLLTRLNQNSAERAHIAAVGNQLGPEGTKAPQVIGDFVGLSANTNISVNPGRNGKASALSSNRAAAGSSSSSRSGSTSGSSGRLNANLSEVLQNIRLGGDDDEVNELDGEEYGEEGNIEMDYDNENSNSALGGMSEAKRREALSAASAVDPQQLIGAVGEGSSIPWGTLGDFEPNMGDDDDELDENDPALEELGLALAPKSQREKRKTRRKGTVVYPPEVQNLLGMANHAYVNRDYKQAVDLFQQVIVTHPSVFQAWNIMGVIQEELGNTEKALQLYLVAAHLTPKDGALWKKLAIISKNCGYNQQALYCFSRAYRADKNDMDALWDRSIMYHVLGQSAKAIQGFQRLLKVKQHYMPALEELVKIYSSLDQDHKRYREHMHQAMVDYEAAYLHYSSLPDQFANNNGDPFDVTDETEENRPPNEPFGYSALNMLSELYIMFEEYEKPIKMIKTWARRLQRRSHQTWWDDYKDDREFDTDPDDELLQEKLDDNRTRGLPVDLRVKLGICRLMMEEVKEAKAQFRYLWRCSVEEFSDLYEEIAELYVNKQMWKEGYNVVRAMLQYDEMDVPKVWIMAGECLRHTGKIKEAKDYLEQAHRADPNSVDVSMMLAEVYEEIGDLPQALRLVNYVRQVNAERQAAAEKRRWDARQARLAKEGAPLDDEYSEARLRNIIPHPSFEAARGALERITEASRSRAVAERYTSADRDRDVQLVKSVREQERAGKLADKENGTQALRDVIEKFNRIELIFQRIDQKEKSRVWDNKREAVMATRDDRTQYIQAARELINVFRSNRGFFPKEKNKPYMGIESRTWRYRRYAADVDTVLSEHVTEMSERLARAMGIAPQRTPAEDVLENTGMAPPTSYKEVSFDTWYLLMIRQAVYLTFEDRYAEAAELLMVMFSSNVCYSVPRRRSGIMLVLLSCAMWVGDHGAILNAGRWLANFGGTRPFPLKIYQAIYTTGPRNHQKFFVWVQNVTYKYLRRHIERMRKAIGKGTQHRMRKSHKSFRRTPVRPIRRGPNKRFQTMPLSLATSNKRLKSDSMPTAQEKPVSFPWRSVLGVVQPVVQQNPGHDATATKQSSEDVTQNPELWKASPAVAKTRISPLTARSVASEVSFTNAVPVSKDGASADDISSRIPGSKVSFAERDNEDSRTSLSASKKSNGEFAAANENAGPGESQDVEAEEVAGPTASVMARRKKRRLEDENAEGTQDDEDDDDRNENFDDEDEFDVDDDLYKTEDEESKDHESDDDAETEWERGGLSYPGSRSRVFGKSGHRGDNDDDDDDADDDDDDIDNDDVRRINASRLQHAKKALNTPHENVPRPRNYTKEVHPSFHIALVMFLGHVLAQSRTHVGSAAQFVECMDYAPYNPMIQFYLSIQFMNLAMQRTTHNRQVTLAQGLTFLQNYYRLRSVGYGALAFNEREKENKVKGKAPYPPPIGPVHSIIGVVGENVDWRARAAKTSMDAISSTAIPTTDEQATASELPTLSSPASAAAAVSPVVSASEASRSKSNSTSNLATEDSSSSSSAPLLENNDPPLTQCRQEAEYNMARAFQQLGQNHLAIIHYRRVLELPSWRDVERQQEALRKKQEETDKDTRRKARAERRTRVLEEKMKRAQEARELNDAKRAEAQAGGNQNDQEEEEEEEEADFEMEEDELSEDEEEDVDRGSSMTGGPPFSKAQLQGFDDEDPTDLKSEAAFNLSRIYMSSGAMGEAQLLIHKYCTF
ncbi:transcription factor TFIIIC subunit tfc4 [Dissophora ornata]|nr:transcription factor TFIIIC subunit tfc4 [Dissophora ornata]